MCMFVLVEKGEVTIDVTMEEQKREEQKSVWLEESAGGYDA